ncbi:TPA: hypothetical protein N0F65_001667 [Lagenidium giganteum]|uniref:RGS domain-containing protein n=1 Tax=Lagenidium giganteum TaxID=4803 RepID=A0AAV2YXR7_9STRA|nr:TPA: hypothetical protein N0F65_001667 [Lagenidium giganteum]
MGVCLGKFHNADGTGWGCSTNSVQDATVTMSKSITNEAGAANALQDNNATPAHVYTFEKGAPKPRSNHVSTDHKTPGPYKSDKNGEDRDEDDDAPSDIATPRGRIKTSSNLHAISLGKAGKANSLNGRKARSTCAIANPGSVDALTALAQAATPTNDHFIRPPLQHSGSDVKLHNSPRGGKRRAKKPVEIGLDVLLKDERARNGFFRYLQATALQEKLKDDENQLREAEEFRYLRATTRTSNRVTLDYREDCLLFWLEISDLLKVPTSGTFMLGLMDDIFDVYIAKGAVRQLPMVSAAEREPLAHYLLERNSEKAMLSFKMLLLDALEVVTTHFDEYVRAEGKLGFNHVMKGTSMRNILGKIAKINVAQTSGDRRGQLNDIVTTPTLCRMFREFLQERNSVENLLFIIDALAFEDLVNTFESEKDLQVSPDGESHQDYCLRQAQKIFNKYIRYGSKAEICLSTQVKEKLLQDIVEYPLGANLFHEAVLLCVAELVNSHLDMFYRSVPYQSYQQAKQQAAAAASTQARRRSMPKLLFGGTEKGNPVGAYIPSDSDPTLHEILNGNGVNFFRDFLKEDSMENSLFFYKEVAQFQLLPHGQKYYIQNKARKIFDKYVRRGAKLEVELPLDVRRDILWKLAAPSEYTFLDAQKYIFNLWEKNYLEKFRKHRLYREMMAIWNASFFSAQVPSNEQVVPSNSSPTASTAQPAVSGASAPTTDLVDVSKIPLRDFLDLELLRRYFRLFLEKEQCVNELYFYFEISNFQQLPTSDYLTRQAKKLFNRFCDPGSREYVMIKTETASDMASNVNNPSPAMFNRAQEEILTFFGSTLFPKFQQSEIYRSIKLTNAQLKAARQLAHGATENPDIPVKTTGQKIIASLFSSQEPRPSSSENGTSSTSSTAAARLPRGSVWAGATAAELPEESVTVTMILEHPESRALFLFFAEEIFCTESIYFWLDCNEYKDIPHRNYLKLRAQKIYRKYISGHAKLQVNLESNIIRDIVAHLDDPHRTTFVAAQKSITRMLERDTLPKFRKSKHNWSPRAWQRLWRQGQETQALVSLHPQLQRSMGRRQQEDQQQSHHTRTHIESSATDAKLTRGASSAVIDPLQYRPTRLDVWLLGLTIVIGGQYFSWNAGMAAGAGSYFITYIIMAAGYLTLCCCMAEVTSALPFSGGAYGLARCTLGFYFGFLIGCCEVFEYITYVSTSVIGLTQMVIEAIPELAGYDPLIWFIFFAISLPIHLYGRRVFWFTNFVLGVISIFVVMVFVAGSLPYVDMQTNALNYTDLRFVDGMHGFMKSFPLAAWFFVGIEALSMSCDEVGRPKVNVPYGQVACMMTLLITGLFVLLVAISLPPGLDKLAGETAPFNRGFMLMFGLSDKAATVFTIPATFATAFGFVWSYGKIISAMALSRLLPQSWATMTQHNTPSHAIIAGSVLSYLFCVGFYIKPSVNDYLFNICMLCAFTIYTAQCLGYIVLRMRKSGLDKGEFCNPFGYYGAVFSISTWVLGIVSIAGFQGNGGVEVFTFLGLLFCFSFIYAAYAKPRQTFSAQERKFLLVAYIVKHNNHKASQHSHGNHHPVAALSAKIHAGITGNHGSQQPQSLVRSQSRRWDGPDAPQHTKRPDATPPTANEARCLT